MVKDAINTNDIENHFIKVISKKTMKNVPTCFNYKTTDKENKYM